MQNLLLRPTLLALAIPLITGCSIKIKHADHAATNPAANHPAMMEHHENMWASVTEAVAVLYPTKGNSASGTLHLTQLPNSGGVHIHGTLTGLDPNSTHAFHIHEFGDPSAPDGLSAGGHYNPDHHPHGGPASPEHHAGDLGNLIADASGTATIDLTAPDLSIAGMHNPIIGRSIVLHAKPDDLTSQPAGNAGPRLAVGAIGIAKP